MSEPFRAVLDEHGAVALDGTWDFWPRDDTAGQPDPIEVPGLWEAQGWLEVDGYAWYRRRFLLDDPGGWWTLRFGGVMDIAAVWLNDAPLGGHDNPFTPFSVDPTGLLRGGENTLCVRVFDPPVDHPEHIRMPHGKQGWANHVFPSRPSLYMTYGGIWQPVVLRRHGPLVVEDVFVNSDPDDLRVQVTVRNVTDSTITGRVGVRVVGRIDDDALELPPRATLRHVVMLGRTQASQWSPTSPSLHQALVDLTVDGMVSDRHSARFGLRTVRVEGTRVIVNGEPYRMKSALVQGFRARELYAEGDRAAIEDEVRAAAAMGFNTLRLHIKAFDPVYLEVCDELGMLLHCDVPVAEPIDHEHLGADGESIVATRCVEAVRQQIERDRNHPSVILWSLMNELCLDRLEARSWDRYERFARALVAAARASDPTRPVIENDWVEPDPDRVFAADVLTAHWYGRLHAEYLTKIAAACAAWSGIDKPLYVTEFGDWGLPSMPAMAEPPFWDTRAVYEAGLAETCWPGSIGRFVTETQRYQGLSDRLQAEVFRRYDHIGGYCVTELTDVPHELNGLLDLHRAPKPLAVAEMVRANRRVLPMLELPSLVVVAGEVITAHLHVANDGPELTDVAIEVRFANTAAPVGMDRLVALDTSKVEYEVLATRFDESTTGIRAPRLAAHRAQAVGTVAVTAPLGPGSHDLRLRLRSGDGFTADNRYTVHVVERPAADVDVRVLGTSEGLTSALAAVGASVSSDRGPTVVPEGALDASAARKVRQRLAAGEVVVVLAQEVGAAVHYPVEVSLFAVQTKWGSSVFHFTTDHGAIGCLPRRNVLVAEDSTVQARSVIISIDGARFPDTPVVIAYKPVPHAMTGTVVGSHQVGPGRLVVCQYRLCEGAAAGDAAARALLADVLRWAAVPQRRLRVEEAAFDGGRRVARYSHDPVVAR